MNITRHFTLAELTTSEIASRRGLNNDPGHDELQQIERLCEMVLEPLRESLHRPVVVLSGYRSPEVNRLAKGSKTSHHMAGRAADIIVPGMTPLEVCNRIRMMRLPFEQCIHEFGGWCHVSVALNPATAKRELLTARASGGRVLYQSGLLEG